MGRRTALLIGNDDYRDADLQRLIAPWDDVVGLKDALEDVGDFDTMSPLYNADLASVQTGVTRLFSGAGPDDLILLYYTGHGVRGKNGDLFFALPDTDVDLLPANALAAAFIRDAMHHSDAAAQVVILDCCHSGAFSMAGAKRRGTPEPLLTTDLVPGGGDTVEAEGKYVLTASEPNQSAYELGGQSVFTRHLVAGLTDGSAAPEKDSITIQDLHDYLYRMIKVDGAPQRPMLMKTSATPDLTIARNSNPRRPLKQELLDLLWGSEPYAALGAAHELISIAEGPDRRQAEDAREELRRRLERTEDLPVLVADPIRAHLEPVSEDTSKAELENALHAAQQELTTAESDLQQEVERHARTRSELSVEIVGLKEELSEGEAASANISRLNSEIDKLKKEKKREHGTAALLRLQLEEVASKLELANSEVETVKDVASRESDTAKRIVRSLKFWRNAVVPLLALGLIAVGAWSFLTSGDVDEQLVKARNETDAARSEASSAKEELLQARGQVDAARAEVSSVKQELAEAQKDSVDAKYELASVQALLSDAEKKLGEMEDQLEDGQPIGSELAEANQKIEDAENELAKVQRELVTEKNTRFTLEKKVEYLETQLGDEPDSALLDRDQVRDLQKNLNYLGYGVAADGTAGRETLAATNNFLRALRRSPVTELREETLSLIEVAVASRRVADRSATRSVSLSSSDTVCDGCPEMVRIPGGTFLMGSPVDEEGRGDDEKQHEVSVEDFAIARTEVTFYQWQLCVDDGGCQSNPNPEDAGSGRGNRPVINVSWNDAQEYIDWLNTKHDGLPFRLPTEAEWEFAARAGTTTPFAFGETISTDQANYLGTAVYGSGVRGENRRRTVPVDILDAANDWGLRHMHGNVYEWVEDVYEPDYSRTPVDGSAHLPDPLSDGHKRVVRGGSWKNDPRVLRSAFRVSDRPGVRDSYSGFRPARTVVTP